jgi:hypothetical protein
MGSVPHLHRTNCPGLEAIGRAVIWEPTEAEPEDTTRRFLAPHSSCLDLPEGLRRAADQAMFGNYLAVSIASNKMESGLTEVDPNRRDLHAMILHF